MMKVKLNFSLPAVAIMLSMMAVSVYAHPGDSHHRETGDTIALENPLTVTPVEKAKVGPEVTANTVVGNQPPTSEATSATESSVSKWLEARATEDAGNGESLDEEAPIQDPEIEGAGWCDLCGCWVRHGCDPNGNCNIMHISVCGGMGSGCYLHGGGCYSSS